MVIPITYQAPRTQARTHMSVHMYVKWSRYRPGVAQRVGRGIALLFHDRGTRRGERSAERPGRTLPPGKTRHPFYRRLGGPQGWSGRAENLVPTGIRSRTVQPVVSRYTDRATRPTYICMYSMYISGVASPNVLCVRRTSYKNSSPICAYKRTTEFS